MKEINMICLWCEDEMTEVDDCIENKSVRFPDGSEMPSIPNGNGKCHDCNVKSGGHHHPGCDMEVCPKCSGQLIACGCLSKKTKFVV